MKKIIIVEDTKSDQDKLNDCIKKFYENVNENVSIKCYYDGSTMINEFKKDTDIIFLDIDLPQMDGISVAKKIREIDEDVIIIFVSNLAQFALKGYEVAALDYIVKPFDYTNIEHRLRRVNKIHVKKNIEMIVLKISANNHIILPITDLCFVEKDANYLVFHTIDGNSYRVRGTFVDYENELLKNNFSYCVKGCLINLAHVEKISNDIVIVDGFSLPISRHRKKDFTNALFDYLDQRNGEN